MTDSKNCIHPDKDKHRFAVHECPYVKADDKDSSYDSERYVCTKCDFRDRLYYEEMG